MRAFLAVVVVCVAALPAAASSIVEPGKPERMIVRERIPEPWQGRHHYLFDETYRTPQTDGAGSGDEDECVPVKLRRTDGVSVTRRPAWCRE